MAVLPYFPFYPADWLSSPRIMCSTLAQQGAYIRLLCVCWMSNNCSLPDDDNKLVTLSGLPEQELLFVRQMFTKHPHLQGCLTNDRLYKEWVKAVHISEGRSKAGRKSGKSRRTNVQQVLNKSINKTRTKRTYSESDSEVITQNQIQIQNQSQMEEKDKKRISASAHAERHPPKTAEVWADYRSSYHDRYHVDPVRNMQVNAMLSKLVDKLGKEEAPLVAAFYLKHNNPFYVQKRHPVNLLLQDAEGLRTQWATGIKATTNEARNMETQDNMREQNKRVMKLLNQGGEA